jgi:hypothetical protein
MPTLDEKISEAKERRLKARRKAHTAYSDAMQAARAVLADSRRKAVEKRHDDRAAADATYVDDVDRAMAKVKR